MKRQRFLIPVLSVTLALSAVAFGGGQVAAQNGPTGEVQPAAAKSEPFTATTGLERFSSYRMNLSGEFDGTKDGQPSSGSFSGFFEATKNPKAQHLRVDMDGDTLSTFAPLGRIEVYDVNNIYYVQNPQDGSWLTIPR